ncbi:MULTISPECIES: DNA-binding protein [Acinetobacter]|uniref:DNA-binding protein n=1 Tax=Acinetobacter piscicola TaxID=2006115 RepID=A0A7S7AHT2_9GAMM|nr:MULTISPECIES: DNA-binding protein [Acinetobacter]MDM1758181.1 DNA-binding protein [Acinetobacter sp. 256-1]QOW46021.1 DNA-binding protein [Acinetobacter piscicola]
MGALKKYVVTFESTTPPQIVLGQNIGGAVVKELKEVEIKLVSAAQLAKIYNLSVNTIRDKLASINQGTAGKFLYNPTHAHTLLTQKTKRGRPRAN